MKDIDSSRLKTGILVINPGSTSTKIAVYDGEDEIFGKTLRHAAKDLAEYENIADQLPFRKALVMDALKEEGLEPEDFVAVVCRGGLIRPLESGTYRVNRAMVDDCREGIQGEHASNLGAMIGYELEQEWEVPAFIVDPPSVDELDAKAKVSGHPIIKRTSLFHALNQKAVARRYAKEKGVPYEDLRLVVCHMGGGVSGGAHLGGRIVDTENSLGGDGPFTPTRAGSMPVNGIIDLCFSGEHDRDEIITMMTREGGMIAYTGTSSMQELLRRAGEGDEDVALIIEAFIYQMAKEVASMSVALRGRVDAIILTGGIAHSEELMARLMEQIDWIAPITVYPGEEEMLALAQGALRVLEGEEEAREY